MSYYSGEIQKLQLLSSKWVILKYITIQDTFISKLKLALENI